MSAPKMTPMPKFSAADAAKKGVSRQPCERCGVHYSDRGMTTHMRGLRCNVDTSIKKNRDNGFGWINRKWEGIVRGAGLTYHKDLAIYVAGGPGKESVAEVGLYMPFEVVEFIRQIVQIPDGHADFVLKTMIVAKGQTDSEFRKAFMVLHSMLMSKHGTALLFPNVASEIIAEFKAAYIDIVARWP
jgi:hypothetical protein